MNWNVDFFETTRSKLVSLGINMEVPIPGFKSPMNLRKNSTNSTEFRTFDEDKFIQKCIPKF
jgi:hypothetical protein